MLRGKVLAREPKTFQQLRKAVSLVKMELSGDSSAANQTSDIQNLCAMFTSQMAELQKTISAQVNAIGTHQQPDRFQRNFRPHDQREHYQQQSRPQRERHQQSERRMQNECPGCGKSCPDRLDCPAFNTKCNYCSKWHHYENVCFKKQKYYHNAKHTPTNKSS